MDEIKDRQELLLEIEQLKLDNARLGQRMDKMRKWNNSLLQKNWQESEDQTLLEFSEQDSEIPNPQELLQELRIHQEELRVQNEELLEIRYSLEESRSRYQALFRNSPLPCLVLNESSRILELNHQAANLLAQANPDLHPERMPMSLFLHRYSQENFRRFFDRVLRNSEAQREEWKLRDEQIVVAHGFALAPTEDGRIEGCQVVLENVTLQRQEELQKLQEREYRLLQAQQLARLGDWQWEEGQIFCSPHLFTLLKIHPSTSPTNFFQAYLDRVPENDQEKVRSKWQQAIEKCKPFTLSHYYLLPDGDRLQLRVQGSPVQRTGTHRYLGFVQVIESEETKSAH
ncbi:MAG: PAS domain-containing protein [Deltaproteobacteria bacterium]